MTARGVHSTVTEMRLSDMLYRAADRYPNKGMLYETAPEGLRTVEFQSYPDLLRTARQVLAGLRAVGGVRGRRVAICSVRPQQFIPIYWACVLGGLVPCPLPPIPGDKARWATQMEYLQHLLEEPLFIMSDELLNLVPDLPDLCLVKLGDLYKAEGVADDSPADTDAEALLVLTSGSTGTSKAVVHTARTLLCSMNGKNDRQQLGSEDTTLNWISFDHVAALLECHLLPLFVGANQVHVAPEVILEEPTQFLALINKHSVTMTFTPNFLLGLINSELSSGAAWPPERGLSQLRHIVSGGESVVCATGRRFLELLRPAGLSPSALWPAFGMTETCAGSIYSTRFPEGDVGREYAALGVPILGLEMRIVDDQGTPLPVLQPGELQLRGSMIFKGYLNNATATRDAFTEDGWFRTGDLGCLDDSGQLMLIGRSKDSIIVDGVNYFSHDLEGRLDQLEGIKDSYVAAFPTRPSGADTEGLVIAFVPNDPHQSDAELYRLVSAVRSTTILHWGFRPVAVLPLSTEQMPKTSLGKIQRSPLRRKYEDGVFADSQKRVDEVMSQHMGEYVAPLGRLEEGIAEAYASMLGVAATSISSRANFFDLGGTSLDVLRLKREVEKRLDLAEVPVISLLQAQSVADLAAKISQEQSASPKAYDPLMPLQLSGTGTPLFCIHPGVGEVLVFVNMAKYFVEERPIYALRARGFEESESFFESFDEMVKCYANAITKTQPRGPYAICGYSYGGAVAFEVAKILEAQGERVDFVGIFNLPPEIRYRMRELDYVEGAVNLALFLSLIDQRASKELPNVIREQSEGKEEVLRRVWEQAAPGRIAALDLSFAKFARWADVTESLLRLGRTYVPSGNVRAVSVFYAIPLRGTKEDWLELELKRWNKFTREENVYIDVPGEHYTLMGPAHLAEFQDILRTELKRTLGVDG